MLDQKEHKNNRYKFQAWIFVHETLPSIHVSDKKSATLGCEGGVATKTRPSSIAERKPLFQPL